MFWKHGLRRSQVCICMPLYISERKFIYGCVLFTLLLYMHCEILYTALPQMPLVKICVILVQITSYICSLCYLTVVLFYFFFQRINAKCYFWQCHSWHSLKRGKEMLLFTVDEDVITKSLLVQKT